MRDGCRKRTPASQSKEELQKLLKSILWHVVIARFLHLANAANFESSQGMNGEVEEFGVGRLRVHYVEVTKDEKR